MGRNNQGSILITGGAGFIGSHAAEYFARNGWRVTVLDNLSRPEVRGLGVNTRLYNWNYLSQFPNVFRVRGSVLNSVLLTRLVKDSRVVLHAAGQVAVTSSLTDPVTDFKTNALGTFNVLEASRKSGSVNTLLFCSTNKVYGENVNSIPVISTQTRYQFGKSKYLTGIAEDFSTDNCKHSPYGASKLSADTYVQEYGMTYGLKTGVFRMSCIYGDRQFGSEDQGWVAHFILSVMSNRPITIYGDGKQVRDVLYVDDLVKAYDAFIHRSNSSIVVNMGGGNLNKTSLLDLLKLIEKKTGRVPRLKFSDWRNSDQKIYVSDISKAQRLLKWSPTIPLSEGVDNLIGWASTLKPEKGAEGGMR